MNPQVANAEANVNIQSDSAGRNLRALGYGILALVSIGNAVEYTISRLSKSVDIPGISAFVTPEFVHNSGYDIHLRSAELVVNTPGGYALTLMHGDKQIDSKNFVVVQGETMTIPLNGTPRGGLLSVAEAGFNWANFPGEFTLAMSRRVGGDSENYSVQF